MSGQTFNFDEVIDRSVVPALKTHPMVIGKDVENLFAAGVADMDFKAPPVVLDALQKRLDHGVFGYEAVHADLFPALCSWCAYRHNWQVEPDYILRAPNILNALAIAVSVFTAPGDGVIIQPPVFFDFFDILKENQREIVENKLVLKNGRYEIDFADLAAKAADPKVRMFYLCNPHNPVGRVWQRDELEKIAAICQQHGVVVVSDEIHGDLVFKNYRYTPYMSVDSVTAENAIACLSPAKTFNIASCSSAFTIIADTAMREIFQKENSRLTVNKNNAFASAAMLAAYKDGQGWLEEAISYIEGNLDAVRSFCAEQDLISLIEPEGTFLLWLDCRSLNLSPKKLMAFFREQAGWAVNRGEAFGEKGIGFVRVNIACPRQRLLSGLEQLGKALDHVNV